LGFQVPVVNSAGDSHEQTKEGRIDPRPLLAINNLFSALAASGCRALSLLNHYFYSFVLK
jgi:hypothetical protein